MSGRKWCNQHKEFDECNETDNVVRFRKVERPENYPFSGSDLPVRWQHDLYDHLGRLKKYLQEKFNDNDEDLKSAWRYIIEQLSKEL